MSEFRRRLMIAANNADYIQDGLIFQLDGINKGNNPNGWVELINGFVFPYNEHMSLDNDGVVFESGNTCGIDSNFAFPLNGQIEVVCSKTNGNHFIICCAIKESLMFSLYSSYCICATDNFQPTIPLANIQLGKIHSFSYNTNYQYIDNILKTSAVNNRFGKNSSKITLGCRQNNASYDYDGKICSIRVYNRQLTANEVFHNCNVDNMRFNLS